MPRARSQIGELILNGKEDARFWSGRFWHDIPSCERDGKPKRQKRTVWIGTYASLSRKKAWAKLLCIIRKQEEKERQAKADAFLVEALTTHTNGDLVGLAKHTKGRIGEMLVAVDLMRRGFHVFEHVSEFDPCDLLALDAASGRVIKIEVKFAGPSLGKPRVRVYARSGRFDFMAVVAPDGVIYYLDVLGNKVAPNWASLVAVNEKLGESDSCSPSLTTQ